LATYCTAPGGKSELFSCRMTGTAKPLGQLAASEFWVLTRTPPVL
jgi:hypothetical protein